MAYMSVGNKSVSSIDIDSNTLFLYIIKWALHMTKTASYGEDDNVMKT